MISSSSHTKSIKLMEVKNVSLGCEPPEKMSGRTLVKRPTARTPGHGSDFSPSRARRARKEKKMFMQLSLSSTQDTTLWTQEEMESQALNLGRQTTYSRRLGASLNFRNSNDDQNIIVTNINLNIICLFTSK